jgi:hypothetical protein
MFDDDDDVYSYDAADVCNTLELDFLIRSHLTLVFVKAGGVGGCPQPCL